MSRVPRGGGRALATPGVVRARWKRMRTRWQWRRGRGRATPPAGATEPAQLPPLSLRDMEVARGLPEGPSGLVAAAVGHTVARGRSYGRGLQVNIDGSQKPFIRWPRLHYASLHGQLEDVKQCLREGADVDEVVTMRTAGGHVAEHVSALYLAAQCGHARIVKYLTARGALLVCLHNCTLNRFYSPASIALTMGHIYCWLLLKVHERRVLRETRAATNAATSCLPRVF